VDSLTTLITIAHYARGQWGMVTSAQAVAAGVSYMQLKRMTDGGLLERAGPGVYLMIGGQAAAERNMAHKVAYHRLDPAVPAWERQLLGRNGAVVSHSSAAVLLRLGDLVVRDVEFITTRRRTTREPGVRLHHVPLAPYEVTWADNLPVTTATRTLVDLLATGIAASHAGSFLAEALDRRMLSVSHVISELAPSPGSMAVRLVTARPWSRRCSTRRRRPARARAAGSTSRRSPTSPASCSSCPTASCSRCARWPPRPASPWSPPCSPGWRPAARAA
jgi:hypothetical protein